MRLIAQTPIRHDGVDYAAGDLLEVADGTALIASGAAVPAPDDSAAAPQPAPKPAKRKPA